MNTIKSKPLITENFLLQSSVAETLYHDFAKDMPIIDYHNHLSAQEIAENKPVGNITKAWLEGDHYKWRSMRANGVEEKYITGNASDEDKFLKWAETVPYTLRNPLFHWTQLELKRYFNIDTVLQPSTAKEIYAQANEVLKSKTPAQLLEDMKVEVACTTDDPTDDLKYHKQIAKSDFYTKVYPTFRADALFFIEQEDFNSYLLKLKSCVGFDIDSIDNLFKAIAIRIDFFHDNGCRLSDYGITGALSVESYTKEEVEKIFHKFLKGDVLSSYEVAQYRSCILVNLSEKYHEKNWVQQFHLGVIRNNNKRLVELVGADVGCDSIGEYPVSEALSKLFNQLDYKGKLAKTIAYNLNPSQNEVFATMLGNFNTGGTPGKMQYGSGWWYLDQKDGMEKQINTLSNIGLLARFVGMLTDSRSFLSMPRHEYFRRILCDLLAEDIQKGLLPNDINFIGEMVQDICYSNAHRYFRFKK
jgi:glucuronate isomerase